MYILLDGIKVRGRVCMWIMLKCVSEEAGLGRSGI